MLHCGNEFLKQFLNFGFTVDAIVTSIWKHYKNLSFRNSWNYFFRNIKFVQKRFYSLLYNPNGYLFFFKICVIQITLIVLKYTTKNWFSINRCFKLLVMTGSFTIPPEQIDYSNFLTYEKRGRFKTK